MYHLQDVTLSFTIPKWHIYECPIRKAPSLSREGWGGSPVGLGWVSPSFGRVGVFLTLHRNPLISNELRCTVKFFYLMQLFNNTISIQSEMYHQSLLRTFIAQIFWPFGNMFVLLPSEIHKTRKYGTTAWTKQSATESLSGASQYERGTRSHVHMKLQKSPISSEANHFVYFC